MCASLSLLVLFLVDPFFLLNDLPTFFSPVFFFFLVPAFFLSFFVVSFLFLSFCSSLVSVRLLPFFPFCFSFVVLVLFSRFFCFYRPLFFFVLFSIRFLLLESCLLFYLSFLFLPCVRLVFLFSLVFFLVHFRVSLCWRLDRPKRWTALSCAAEVDSSKPLLVCGVREWRKIKVIGESCFFLV